MWSMLGSSFGQVMSLLIFLFLAKFVSRESFGVMAVSLTTIEMVRRLAVDPIATATMARPGIHDSDYDAAFTLTMIITIVLAILLVILAGPFAQLIGTPGVADVLPVVAAILVGIGLARTHDARLSRAMDFRALAIRNAASVILGGVVGLTMALNGFDLWSLVGQQLTISSVSVVTLWLATPWRPKLNFSFAAYRRTLEQARHIAMGNMWMALAQDSDIYFVAVHTGPVVAGMYNAAKRILLAATLTLSYGVSSVAISALANIGDPVERSRVALRGFTIVSIVILPAFAGLAIIAEDLIGMLFQPQWAQSGPILAALALSGWALGIHLLAGAVLVVNQRAGLNNLCWAFAAVLAISAFVGFGANGAVYIAWTVTGVALLSLPVRLELARRVMSVSVQQIFGAIAPSAFASAVMCILAMALKMMLDGQAETIIVFAVAPLSAAIYGLTLWRIAPSHLRATIEMAHNIIRSRR